MPPTPGSGSRQGPNLARPTSKGRAPEAGSRHVTHNTTNPFRSRSCFLHPTYFHPSQADGCMSLDSSGSSAQPSEQELEQISICVAWTRLDSRLAQAPFNPTCTCLGSTACGLKPKPKSNTLLSRPHKAHFHSELYQRSGIDPRSIDRMPKRRPAIFSIVVVASKTTSARARTQASPTRGLLYTWAAAEADCPLLLSTTNHQGRTASNPSILIQSIRKDRISIRFS
jgi:hypothetical protein